jgi:hypothetical protein
MPVRGVPLRMSAAGTDDQEETPPLPRRVLRTVTPRYGGRGDNEMNAVGWGIGLGMLVLLVPMLPFIAIVWLLSKGFEALSGRR